MAMYHGFSPIRAFETLEDEEVRELIEWRQALDLIEQEIDASSIEEIETWDFEEEAA